MSFSVQIGIDFNGNLETLKHHIESLIGGIFTQIEDETAWRKYLLGMWFELAENDFVNDEDVDFEYYPFVLITRTSAGTPLKIIRRLQVPITDLIAQLICLELQVEVIVVLDAEMVYARYHPKKVTIGFDSGQFQGQISEQYLD